MRFSILLWSLAALLATTTTVPGETETAAPGERGSIPYNGSLFKLLRATEPSTIDGVECAALFVKSGVKGVALDPKKANFLARTWDDEELQLICDPLSSIPADNVSELVRRKRKEGYTHRLWIPMNEDKFLDGEVAYSLPTGSINFATAAGSVEVNGTQVKLVAAAGEAGKGGVVRGASVDNRSFPALKKAAERGDAKAQNNLGFKYWSGEGVPQDFRKAFEWYSKAAKQGIPGAKYNLGVLYDEGQGVPQDKRKAIELYVIAAKGGFAAAQYKLGQRYFQGISVPQDYKKSFEWHSKAAEQGDLDAQYSLAKMYDEGVGTPQNHLKAHEWYLKAALQGDVGAQNNLAVRYYYGRGVAMDQKEAFAWAHVAAASGHQTAIRMKHVLSSEHLTPPELADAKAKAEELERMIRRK